MQKTDYVIPTWNSGNTLEIALTSIKKYGNPNNIIIIDRESTDATIEIAKRFGCKIITSTSRLGAARRLGAANAETELIAFIDADVELNDQWKKVIECAWEKRYKDAGAVGAYYAGIIIDSASFPIVGSGAFGCTVTFRNLVQECTELDRYSSAEDSVYFRYLQRLGLKWYILQVKLAHHQEMTGIPEADHWRWIGAGLRMKEGFHPVHVKRIMGGAIFGIRINNLDISYWDNFRKRCNYFLGYMRYKKYFELNRNNKH